MWGRTRTLGPQALCGSLFGGTRTSKGQICDPDQWRVGKGSRRAMNPSSCHGASGKSLGGQQPIWEIVLEPASLQPPPPPSLSGLTEDAVGTFQKPASDRWDPAGKRGSCGVLREAGRCREPGGGRGTWASGAAEPRGGVGGARLMQPRRRNGHQLGRCHRREGRAAQAGGAGPHCTSGPPAAALQLRRAWRTPPPAPELTRPPGPTAA